jgi:hypothetical protein
LAPFFAISPIHNPAWVLYHGHDEIPITAASILQPNNIALNDHGVAIAMSNTGGTIPRNTTVRIKRKTFMTISFSHITLYPTISFYSSQANFCQLFLSGIARNILNQNTLTAFQVFPFN